MKIEDQLADLLTKALGRIKFVEICARIGVNQAWDEKKIKEENVGRDFLSRSMASACGIAVVRKGEHPSRTDGAHLVGTVAPFEMAPHGVHWQVRATTTTHSWQNAQ